MTTAFEQDPKRGNGQSKRGTVRNQDRLEAFARKKPGGGGDWAGCHPDVLAAVVAGITCLGGAVLFGMSRDGGAHSCTLILDDSRETLWFNGGADLTAELRVVVDTLTQIS